MSTFSKYTAQKKKLLYDEIITTAITMINKNRRRRRNYDKNSVSRSVCDFMMEITNCCE